MGNPQSTKIKQGLAEPISMQAEIVESAESDSIDISMIPSNCIFTGPKNPDESSSEPFSNASSSEAAINNCFKNGNNETDISLAFNKEVDKQILRIRGDFAEAFYSGIMNRRNEVSEIPMEGQYSEL